MSLKSDKTVRAVNAAPFPVSKIDFCERIPDKICIFQDRPYRNLDS